MRVVTAYVPCDVRPSLTEKDLSSSLCALIAEASGRMPGRAEESCEAVNLDASEARPLGVPPRTAALRVPRTTYYRHGRPFEASAIILRADRSRFRLTLDAGGTTFSKSTR